MPKVYRLLFTLHMFVGVGALAGGYAAIINPQEPFGMSAMYLKNSPFTSFLIPGIILFTVIGLGNIFSAIAMCFKFRYQGYLSSVFSWALVIWIIVQCIMLNAIAFLHILFFIIGLIKAALSIIILLDKKLFPTNIMMRVLRRET